MKYCQGPKCHTYNTQDRKRGPKGNKVNQTRRRSSFYYLSGNACSMQCERDYAGKLEMMKKADEVKKLEKIVVKKNEVKK